MIYLSDKIFLLWPLYTVRLQSVYMVNVVIDFWLLLLTPSARPAIILRSPYCTIAKRPSRSEMSECAIVGDPYWQRECSLSFQTTPVNRSKRRSTKTKSCSGGQIGLLWGLSEHLLLVVTEVCNATSLNGGRALQAVSYSRRTSRWIGKSLHDNKYLFVTTGR